MSINNIFYEAIHTYLFMDTEFKGKTLEERKNILIKKPTEYISEGGKEFRCDVLFDYKSGNSTNNLYTINIEMQKQKENYNMLHRALYCAVNILSQRLKSGDNYNSINKVYIIWFLGFNYFNDNIPIHSISPRVFYNTESEELTDKVKNQSTLIYDTGADIVEVVFIELKKRNEIIKNKALKNILDIICENKKPQNTFKNFFELSDEEVETMIESKSIVERIAEEAAEATIKATIEEATKEAQKQ